MAAIGERARIATRQARAHGYEDGRAPRAGHANRIAQTACGGVRRQRADALTRGAPRRGEGGTRVATASRAGRGAERAVQRRRTARRRTTRAHAGGVLAVDESVAVIVLPVVAALDGARVHRGVLRPAVTTRLALTLLHEVAVSVVISAGRRHAAAVGARTREARQLDLRAGLPGGTRLRRAAALGAEGAVATLVAALPRPALCVAGARARSTSRATRHATCASAGRTACRGPTGLTATTRAPTAVQPVVHRRETTSHTNRDEH
jgi:hypothetical protein